MPIEALLPLVTIGGTLLLVITGLLNFSVFLRQLRASLAGLETAREGLDTARLQLESARLQPEIQLVQRAMFETSEHLKILVERPYLRPYFYESQHWSPEDGVSRDEVLAMAELLLSNFASAIIHSGAFPQYPVRGVEETLRFHLRHSPILREFLLTGFERFQLAGFALLCLKNDSKAEIEADLLHLIAAPDLEPREKARRERFLHYLRNSEQVEPVALAKYSLESVRHPQIMG
ncbi:MAG: hypothetical protein IV090_13430 [Candidatus Sericytochromatia bacterium]|nr:hypothetical protein [Candidatus Sericytochromatia bacterium]